MPHSQRKKGETGFYHVVSKGDGGQVIFESDTDRKRYLALLEQSLDDHKVKVHAYCLMSNHVHLLVQEEPDAQSGMSGFMKQLNERYAMYYGKVTGRVGHVFKGRFWSEPIDSEEHFLSALRYIHCNPEPAGICSAKDYPWSSFEAYIGKPGFVTTDVALGLLDSVPAFEDFHANGGCYAKPFPKSALVKHLSYDELARVAVNLLGRDTLNLLKTMTPKERGKHFERLSEAGFTASQIARLTGIGQSSVCRLLHN